MSKSKTKKLSAPKDNIAQKAELEAYLISMGLTDDALDRGNYLAKGCFTSCAGA